MRFERDHLIFKALCVLDEAVDQAREAPLRPPSAGVRFALAYLWAVAPSGDRKPYDEFWRVIQGIGCGHPNAHARETVRGQSAQTAFYPIARAAGVEPTVALSEAMRMARGGRRGPPVSPSGPRRR
ncbi:hypothetical protein [Sphingobium sp. RAC03]|uniref:hypothetical protein n=1 Tax=Sphingobium sp. RAC03 TaxID=1843368 RepID=UPI0008586A73|nr:hypothetical protein [Sphingobium sp. RAC03]AOF97165.1 hypothetical protein BSY17_2623 [Sphingobium sp. RAC03]